jgi:purine-nucleoside phosphorylase
VSATSWPFSPGGPGARLGEEVRRQTKVENFDLAVVLGSGWNEATTLGETLGAFDYSDWSCFPCGQIAGHAGQLIVVRYSSWNILFFSGRFHCYQGLSAFEASFPVRLASSLGCPRILMTCATGGINPVYRPGDFMLVEDHLNLIGDNPLRGLSGNTFVDMADAYQSDVYAKLLEGDCSKVKLHLGVLAAMSGPSYETPAEVRFLSTMGADVVSMSTVPEVIMARYLGLHVAAVAFISNVAAGLASVTLSHEDVLDCGVEHSFLFPLLIRNFVDAWQTVPDRR